MNEEPPKADHGGGDLTVQQAADIVASQLDADVIHYNGPVARPADAHFIAACKARRRRKNVLFSLVTKGGDAHAAYRIAQCLQEKYERFYFHVTGYCKSAGTLVALGAHQLVMSDHGELGPLDVQMRKKDELWAARSGLAVHDAMGALRQGMLTSFQDCFHRLTSKSGGALTSVTAAKIATDLTVGMYAPICSQVDPMHIGEARRAMTIAGMYGGRLLAEGGNLDMESMYNFLFGFPSHGFVIDRSEAKKQFRLVREQTTEEEHLAYMLGNKALWPNEGRMEGPPFQFLSSKQV